MFLIFVMFMRLTIEPNVFTIAGVSAMATLTITDAWSIQLNPKRNIEHECWIWDKSIIGKSNYLNSCKTVAIRAILIDIGQMYNFVTWLDYIGHFEWLAYNVVHVTGGYNMHGVISLVMNVPKTPINNEDITFYSVNSRHYFHMFVELIFLLQCGLICNKAYSHVFTLCCYSCESCCRVYPTDLNIRCWA